MELATEDHSGLIGACDRDFGCIYMNTLSWRTPTTPMPMEINPRKVFERMFGQGDSEAARLVRRARRPQHPRRRDGPSDGPAARPRRARPRDARRLSRRRSRDRAPPDPRRVASRSQRRHRASRSAVGRAVRVHGPRAPDVRLAHARLSRRHHARVHVHDGREVSNRTYTQVGVTEGHHAVSHHQNRAEKLEMLARIQAFHIGLFGEFVREARRRPGRRRLVARQHDAAVRQQHEQQQRARSLPAAERPRRRRPRPAQGRPAHRRRGSCADDEPAR